MLAMQYAGRSFKRTEHNYAKALYKSLTSRNVSQNKDLLNRTKEEKQQHRSLKDT